MKNRNGKIVLILMVVLSMLLSGCGTKKVDNHSGEDLKDETPAKVLLGVYTYGVEDALESQVLYHYDENGLLTDKEIYTYYTADEPYESGYHYTYDSEGRLLEKMPSEDLEFHADEEIQRTYNDAGYLVEEQALGPVDTWTTTTYEYDAAGELISETVSGLGDTVYEVSREEASDGGYILHKKSVDSDLDIEFELKYDSAGRIVQDYDPYWLEPIRYAYFDDPYFILRDEILQGEDLEIEMRYKMAYICDSAGNVIESINLGQIGETEVVCDADGYITEAKNAAVYADWDQRKEFVYGEPGDSAELRDPLVKATDTPYLSEAANGYDAVLLELTNYLREVKNNPNDYDLTEKLSQTYSVEYRFDPESYGYTFMDLNGDGQNELLIGRSVDDEYHYGLGNINDLFTIKDGELIHLYSSGARFMMSLCEDGTLRTVSSGSAFDTTWQYFTIQNGALVLMEGIRYDENSADEANGADPFFYSKTDPYDSAQRTVISREEAEHLTNEVYVPTHIEYTAFSL